jgi:lipoprotein-anchoring transpeptidase ErfK/SrfK
MLRLRILVLACLPLVASSPLRAEAAKAEPAPALGPASTASPSSAPANADVKPQATATADTIATPSEDAPANSEASTPSAEAAKPAEEKTAAAPAPVPVTLTAQIDLARQTMVVSEDGEAKYTWPISSGTAEHPTPRGTFRPEWTAKMWYSRKYDNAPMPNAVFISGGVAIHATPYTRYLGSPASHGCIRLAPGNAATFYKLVHQHGLKATKVSVYGTPKWRAPAVARRDDDLARRYAAQQPSSGGLFGIFGGGYKPTSAYDPGFTQRKYRRAAPQAFAYNDRPRRIVYRSYDGSRLYYVQRPPRRVYYNGNGYGSGW